MPLVPSQAAGRRLFVKNVSSNTVTLFSGVDLTAGEEVDVFVEDPTITDARALDDMVNPVGSLYIETSINNTVRVIDFDTEDAVVPDVIRGHNNRVVFSRPKDDISEGSNRTATYTSGSGVLVLYVDPNNGDNNNDGLSWDTAFGDIYYALDTIPDGMTSVYGRQVFIHHAAGNYTWPRAPGMNASGAEVWVIADTRTPLVTGLDSLTENAVAGRTVRKRVDISSFLEGGTYSDTITMGNSHWMLADFTSFNFGYAGYALLDSTSPNIDVCSNTSFGVTEIHPYSVFITLQGSVPFFDAPTSSFLFFVGFDITISAAIYAGTTVSLYGCHFDVSGFGSINGPALAGCSIPSSNGFIVLNRVNRLGACNLNGAIFQRLHVEVDCGITACISLGDHATWPAVWVQKGVTALLSGIDVEGARPAIDVSGGGVVSGHVSNFGVSLVGQPTHAIKVAEGGRVDLPSGTITGTTTDVPVVLESGGQATGIEARCDGTLVNGSVSGDEVTVGDAATNTFANLPITDTGQLCRSD